MEIKESYPKECFKFSQNFLRMSFPSSFPVSKLTENEQRKSTKPSDEKGGATGGAIDTEKGGAIGGAIQKLTDRQTAVLQVINSDNKISYRAIAEKMNINESAVLKHVEILKEKGYIERIGGTRGSWKIKK